MELTKNWVMAFGLLPIGAAILLLTHEAPSEPKIGEDNDSSVSSGYVSVTRPIAADSVLTVPQGSMSWYTFDVDTDLMRSVRLVGKFTAHGGLRNDIQVFLTDSDGFENIKNGHAAQTALYSSSNLTVGQVDVPIESSGHYFLIFNNRFSLLSKKYVENGLKLQYEQRQEGGLPHD